MKAPELPPVFVISLRREVERRQHMSAMLAGLGMSYEFVDAVDASGKTIADFDFYNSRRRRLALGKDLYLPELACMASHKMVLERIAASALDWAIVMEDDCVVVDDFPAIVGDLVSLDPAFEFVRFFGDEKHLRRRHRTIARLSGPYRAARIATSPGGAHCYLVSRRGARRLATTLVRASTPVDIIMGQPWKTGLGTISVYPKVAWQKPTLASSIGSDRFSQTLHVHGLERLAFRLANPVYIFRNNILKRLYYFMALPGDRKRFRGGTERPP